MSEKINESENTDVSEGRIYELGYLLLPNITEEEMPAVYGDLKELISASGGNVIADEMPKMMNLAYEMVKVIANKRNKFKNGYFGWIKFEMGAGEVEDLDKKLESDDRLIRHILIKTVRENTIASKRFSNKPSLRTKTVKPVKEEQVEINEEEVDKEIEALVA